MWYDVDQNTDEWLDMRAGKVTGSSIAKVMANFGKAFGSPAKDLAATCAIEQLTGKRQNSVNYTNHHMDRGHIEEPIARALYEEMYFVDVTNGGFYDNGNTGSSPDGRVFDDGLVEIKSAIISVHYARIKKGTFDSAYKWQFIFNMREAKRSYIDFISYCADFPEESKLYVYRLDADKFKQEMQWISERLGQFNELVGQIKDRIS